MVEFLTVDFLRSSFIIALTVVISFLIYFSLSKIVERTGAKVGIQKVIVTDVNRSLKLVIGALALISILGTLGIDITGLLAGVGIAALAVSFAAQILISNLISGLFLIFERALSVGDYIQVGDTAGTVVHMGFRSTQIRTLDGKTISIPNSTMANSNISNFTIKYRESSLKDGALSFVTKNKIVTVIDEVIDFYSDIELAKRLMMEAVRETDGAVVDGEREPVITVEKNPLQYGVTLRLYVTVDATDWNMIRSNIIGLIKKKFDQNKIIPPVPAFARDNVNRIKKDLEESEKK